MRNINMQEFDSMPGKIIQRKPKSNFRLSLEALEIGQGVVFARSEIDAKIGASQKPGNHIYSWAREMGRKYSVKSLATGEFAILRTV